MMGICRDPRYSVSSVLAEHADRQTCLARDLLNDSEVILKSGSPDLTQHEAATLLALPPGIGPQLCNLIWRPPEPLTLVMEKIPGEGLREAAKRIAPADWAPLVGHLAQLLAHLHRSGTVHLDLKPSNFLMDPGKGLKSLRIIDFGFSRSRSGSLCKEDVCAGGTLPYLAPEARLGWAVDHRADQYSLGVLLRELFPSMESDPAWQEILARMTDLSPSKRFRDCVHLREEVSSRFGVTLPAETKLPRLGGGPLVGREQERARLHEILVSSPRMAHILLCGRSGTGLTRFLHEALLAIARTAGPAARAFDLGDPVLAGSAARLFAFLDEGLQTGGVTLWAVPDPSPGLHWLPTEWSQGLRAMMPPESRQRIQLVPLDAGSFTEVVAHGMGSGGASVEEVAGGLAARSEGDLVQAARGFLITVGQCGAEDGLSWSLDCEGAGSALPDSAPPIPSPGLQDVPDPLRRHLGLCALVGASAPRPLVQALLEHFASPGALEALLEHGYLQPGAPGRLRFVTHRIFREALAHPPAREQEALAWIHAGLSPDPQRIDESLSACRRARRLGDSAREAQWLAAALEAAERDRRWHDLRELLAYPRHPDHRWSETFAEARTAEFVALLGEAEWPAPRLMLLMGHALLDPRPKLGSALLERAARSSHAPTCADALLALVERDVAAGEEASYARHLEALETLESRGEGLPAGVLDRIRAWRAQTQGRLADAEKHARRAMDQLHGRVPLQENLCLQLLAVLRFGSDPKEAIALMGSALATAQDQEQVAQISHNLAVMCAHVGRLEACARHAEQGVTALDGRGRSPRLSLLRSRRAWAWASLDRTTEALAEVRSLLELSGVRDSRTQTVLLRLLAGFCVLHQTSSRAAVGELAAAWKVASQGCPQALQFDALRYLIDALLDLRAWDLVTTYGDSLQPAGGDDDPHAPRVRARLSALRAQAAGQPAKAAALLAPHLDEARRDPVRINAARYIHHLGVAQLEEAQRDPRHANPDAAIALLEESARLLEGPAYGYYRGRALLAHSQALALAGRYLEARRSLQFVIDVATSIGSRGLLAESLQARAGQTLDAADRHGKERLDR